MLNPFEQAPDTNVPDRVKKGEADCLDRTNLDRAVIFGTKVSVILINALSNRRQLVVTQ